MAFDIEKTFDNLVIRDTISHISIISDSRQFSSFTVAVDNTLNVAITIQLQGSPTSDFATVFNIGNSFIVPANITAYEDSLIYFPYFRLTAICLVSPISGTISAYLCKRG